MGNDFTSNPWVIEAATSGDVSTSLPTYNGNTGIHVAYGIVSFYWTGATATHVCEVKDVDSERIWKSVCTATNVDPKFSPCEPIVIKGLNVSTLTTGTLYIYHT